MKSFIEVAKYTFFALSHALFVPMFLLKHQRRNFQFSDIFGGQENFYLRKCKSFEK